LSQVTALLVPRRERFLIGWSGNVAPLPATAISRLDAMGKRTIERNV
jgi:hypothetical protein